MRGRRPVEPSRRCLCVLVAAGAVLLGIFLWMVVEVRTGTLLAGFDDRVTTAFIDFRAPGWSRVFWAATLLGDTPMIGVLVASAVLSLAAWGRVGAAALLAAGTASGELISDVAKAVVGRARPPVVDALIAQPSSDSMPSGHSFMSVLFSGLLLYLLVRWARATPRAPRNAALRAAPLLAATTALSAGIVLVGLISLSRVYLGVHWLTDLLGGWVLAGFWLVVILGSPWLRAWAASLDARLAASGWLRLKRSLRMSVAGGLAAVVATVFVLTALGDPLH